MAIYRTLLEEEINILDDNNCNDEAMKELDDIVNDSDVNAEEQERGANGEFDPKGVDDIMDETFIAIAESEAAWNQTMQAIGMKELSETARGVYTESFDDVKDWFRKVKDKIIAFFKKVWQVIQRWAGNLNATLSTNKRFVEKFGSKMRDGYPRYKDYDKKLKGYTFEGLGDGESKVIKGIDGHIQAVIDGIPELKTYLTDPDKLKDALMDLDSKIVKAWSAVSNYSAGAVGNVEYDLNEVRDTAFVAFFGSEDPEELDNGMPVDEVIKILKDTKKDKENSKKEFEKSKKKFKSAIRSIDSLEKYVMSKQSGDSKANTMIAGCQKISSNLNKTLNFDRVVHSVYMSALTKRQRQARRFGNLYVRLANKKKYKGFQDESASFGYLGQLDLI